jgi:hypothetical protein
MPHDDRYDIDELRQENLTSRKKVRSKNSKCGQCRNKFQSIDQASKEHSDVDAGEKSYKELKSVIDALATGEFPETVDLTLPSSDMLKRGGISTIRQLYLAHLDKQRALALSNLYYFDKYVLGYDKMVPHVHGKLAEFVMHQSKRGPNEQTTKLILEPRNSFKSVAITVGYSLWRLAIDPNLTIIITNEKLDKAKGFLKEIKAHITTNDKFKVLFGDLSCENIKTKKWSETRIDILTRTKWSSAPTIEISSVESSEAGKHVDLIICDDLHGQGNTATKDQIDKVIEYWKDLGAVLKPGGEMIIIGTRWDYKDLYQKIQDFAKELGELSNITMMIEKAERDDGTLLFPEVLDKAFLTRQRSLLGNYFFSAQYQNNPVEKENALIKKIEKYSDTINGVLTNEFFAHCKHFITADLAFTENKRSDATAILCVAVSDADGRWYVRQYDTLKTGDPNKIIELIFDYNLKFKPVRYGIEKNNYQGWLKIPLEVEMRKRGIFLPIDPSDGIPHYGDGNAGNSKAARLRKIAPRFNYGEIYIHTSMDELEDELMKLTFDGARGHDDLLDALAMMNEIVYWGTMTPACKDDNEEARNNSIIEFAIEPDEFDMDSKSWLYA